MKLNLLKNKYEDLNRPWGGFEQFTLNEKTTVKILKVKPNSKLSLQKHKYREEYWKILNGKGQVQIDDDIFDVEGDRNHQFYIKKGQLHRIITKNYPLQILEISFGKFDENDIERVEDDYNRVK
jgi:mannose-6-phosphate isomerase-like protein (cupin superfamily)